MSKTSFTVLCLLACLILPGCEWAKHPTAAESVLEAPSASGTWDAPRRGNPYFTWVGTLAPGGTSGPGAGRGKEGNGDPDPGVLDVALLPHIRLVVTGWDGRRCLPVLQTISSEGTGLVRLSVGPDAFEAKLPTKQLGLVPGSIYCLRLFVAGNQIGQADITVGKKPADLAGIDPERMIGVLEGMLHVQFRIDEGAVYLVGPEGRTFTTKDGGMTVAIPPGALDQLSAITAHESLRNPGDPGLVMAYDFTPGILTFAKPLRLTFRYQTSSLGGIPEQELLIHKLAENYVQWLEVDPRADGSNVDPEADEVTAMTPGFGISTYRPWGERVTVFALMRQRRVATLRLAPIGLLLAPGEGHGVTATLRGAFGEILQPRVGRQVSWTVGDGAVAGTTATGPASVDVSALGYGSTNLEASVHGAMASAEISVPAPGGAPAWQEDFSSYASSQAWREAGAPYLPPIGGERQFIDPAHGFGGSPQSLRYDFPDRTAAPDRCSDTQVTRQVRLPAEVDEIWTETWVKFSPNFRTAAPASWGCPSGADLKLLFGLVNPDGTGRFEVKVGAGGSHWATGAPYNQDIGVAEPSLPYWDGDWHRIRTHWRLGHGDGVLELWLDGALIFRRTDVDTRGTTGIYGLFLGSVLNQGPAEAISYWWGQVQVWNLDPGW